jgi:adenylosuccinate synthase
MRMFNGLVSSPESFDAPRVIAAATAAGARLRPNIRETTYMLHGLIDSGKRVLFEGANGALLDVDHGTYPFVTSSSTGVHGIGLGTGVPVQRVGRVLGIMKAYCTRVGSGPMPTELFDETGSRIRERGREYGTTTGRPRRVGWLDLVATKYAVMINGATGFALTMLDVLAGFEEIRICTAYEIDGERTEQFIPDGVDLARVKPVFETLPGFSQEIGTARAMTDLPAPARAFVDRLQSHLGIRADFVSVGPGREQTIAP